MGEEGVRGYYCWCSLGFGVGILVFVDAVVVLVRGGRFALGGRQITEYIVSVVHLLMFRWHGVLPHDDCHSGLIG